MSVEQELTVVDYKKSLGMHILEQMKAHRCTDQLTIWPELYSVSALYEAAVLFLSLVKMVVHAPLSSLPGWREKLHSSDSEISVLFRYSSCLVSRSSRKLSGRNFP